MFPSERLKEIRVDRGDTQKEIAQLLGVNARTWQNYEDGSSKPGMDICEKLVRLGYSATWLLTGEGPMRRDDSGYFQASTGPVPAGTFNRKLMEDLIEFVEQALLDIKVKLVPDAKAKLIVKLYDIYNEDEDAQVDATEIKRHLKLVV
jgi:transcriptional regulator with XRE-family HTH domain